MMRCAMTGRPMEAGDGIYDDGEWIRWDGINGQLDEQDVKQQYPQVDPQLAMLFEDLVQSAQSYHAMTGRYLQIWGELGELYAEVKFGIQRHKPHTPGSDGKLGKDFVEIKTISPEKPGGKVQVKRSGNFNKLLVIKIDPHFVFEGAGSTASNSPRAKALMPGSIGPGCRKRRSRKQGNTDAPKAPCRHACPPGSDQTPAHSAPALPHRKGC